MAEELKCDVCESVKDPEKFLIVVDMQYDFINGALANKDAEAIVPKIAEYIKNFDGHVILFTRDTHGKGYLNTQEGSKLPVEHCIKGTPGWCVHEDLRKAAEEWEASGKNRYVWYEDKGQFGKTNLLGYYAHEPEDEIQICGTCTDICVISNAIILKAENPETPLKVLKDLCAGLTPESHENALKAMAMCQIEVI